MDFYQVTTTDVKNALVNLKQVTFEVTDECNLNCVYCCYGDLYEGYDQRTNSTLSFGCIQQTLDFLAKLWKSENPESKDMTTYVSFYGGEPLLKIPLIKETIHYIEKQGYDQIRTFIYSMTTNAVLLDKHMDYLAEKEIELVVSLDGNEESQSYRIDHSGHNSFHKVFKNLKQLKEKYPDYFEKAVSFNSVLHNRNSVIETASFIFDEFNKNTNITQLSPDHIRCDKQKEFSCMLVNYGESLINSKTMKEISENISLADPDSEELTIFIENNSGNFFKDYHFLLIDENKIPLKQTGACFPFDKKMFITVKGKIMPCERISQEYYYGEVTENAFNLTFQGVAEKYNAWINGLTPVCSLCYQRKRCGECAFQTADLTKKKITCSAFTGEQAYKNYINRNLYDLSKRPDVYGKTLHTQDK